MKKLLFLTLLVFTLSGLTAQDKSAKDFKIQGADAYKAKDYAGGLTAFEKAISMYEAEGKIDTTLYYNAAICAIKVKDYQKSVDLFSRSVELDYKTCKSKLYRANAYAKLGDDAVLIQACEEGISTCPKYKSKFNKLLFNAYMKEGLDIFNNAAKMQADATPLASSDAAKYEAEMEKVKAEFNRSLPYLEKAHDIKPDDENAKKALKQAYEILGDKAKAATL